MLPTFGRVILNRLFEGGDVTEGAEKQDDFVLLISDWGNLYEKPNWHPCSKSRRDISVTLNPKVICAVIKVINLFN